MQRNTALTLVVVVLVLAALAYAMMLHVTGFVADAKEFSMYAASGIGTLVVVMWIFGGFDRGR